MNMRKIAFLILTLMTLVASAQPMKPSNIKTFKANGVKFTMVWVEGGVAHLGNSVGLDKSGASKPEAYEEQVNTFLIGQTEVTRQLWRAVMGETKPTDSSTKNDDFLPMESVTWIDCQKFIARLNQITKMHFRFLTDAEWEYAALGGLKSNGYFFAGSNDRDEVAWHSERLSSDVHPVATKLPNELGLYDMTGNAAEWCLDSCVYYRNGSYLLTPSYNYSEPYTFRSRSMRGQACNIGSLEHYLVMLRDYGVQDQDHAGLRLALDVKDGDKCIYTMKNNEGIRLTYAKTSETEVALIDNPQSDAQISGTLHIPERVKIKGIEYKVTSIADKALCGNPNLYAVYIPATVRKIGNHTLTNCENLTEIVVDKNNKVFDSRDNCNAIINTDKRTLVRGCKTTVIPENIRHIGAYAFYNCASLTHITLPNRILSIRESAFRYCSSLTSVVLPASLQLIDNYAFANVPLKSLVLPNGIKNIRNGAFYENAFDHVFIPKTVERIGMYAFYSLNHDVAVEREKTENNYNFTCKRYYTKGQPVEEYGYILFVDTLPSNENDPVGLYRMQLITYEEGGSVIPDYEQYKYCSKNVTWTLKVNRTDDGMTEVLFYDNDYSVLRYTGSGPVGEDGRGFRIFNSNLEHFTLKWYNRDRYSDLFPLNTFITEIYDAKKGVNADVRTIADILESYPTLTKANQPKQLTGCWERVGLLLPGENGTNELTNTPVEKYKLINNTNVVDLFPGTHIAFEHSNFTTRLKPLTIKSTTQILEGESNCQIEWVADNSFIFTYIDTATGNQFAEVYERSVLPKMFELVFGVDEMGKK